MIENDVGIFDLRLALPVEAHVDQPIELLEFLRGQLESVGATPPRALDVGGMVVVARGPWDRLGTATGSDGVVEDMTGAGRPGEVLGCPGWPLAAGVTELQQDPTCELTQL